jgi:acid stress-induced BolA-like protein IbaG/YrbA
MGSTDDLTAKVKSILEAGFAPAEVATSTRDALVFFIYSDRFAGMDDMDRQDAIWDLLQKTLDSSEQRAVSIVVALTPKERDFHLAGSV